MAAATVESKVEEERPAFEKVTVVADGVSVTGKKAEAFRDYSTASERVHHAYKMMREHQTLEFAARMKAKYLTFSHPHTVWEAARLLDTVVDASDPDVDVGNSHHALQVRRGKPGVEDGVEETATASPTARARPSPADTSPRP